MNYGRIGLGAIAAWLASIALGYLINNIWLLHVYQANAWAFRRAEDISPLLPIGFGAQLIGFLAFAYAYAKGYEGGGEGAWSRVLEGMRFGLIVAVMIDGFATVWNYVTEPIALRLGSLQMIEHIGEFGVYGAIVGVLYAPRQAAESRIANPESLVPSPESRVPNPESPVPNPESRIPIRSSKWP